jgi:hypothetical protein
MRSASYESSLLSGRVLPRRGLQPQQSLMFRRSRNPQPPRLQLSENCVARPLCPLHHKRFLKNLTYIYDVVNDLWRQYLRAAPEALPAEALPAAALPAAALPAYHQIIGLELGDVSVDGCLTKAPCGGDRAGPFPAGRRKGGLKCSVASDGRGIPLGIASAGANRYDSPLLAPTLAAAERQLDGILPMSGRATWTAATTAP